MKTNALFTYAISILALMLASPTDASTHKSEPKAAAKSYELAERKKRRGGNEHKRRYHQRRAEQLRLESAARSAGQLGYEDVESLLVPVAPATVSNPDVRSEKINNLRTVIDEQKKKASD